MPKSAPRPYRITPRARPPKKQTGGLGSVAVGAGGGGGSGVAPVTGQVLQWNGSAWVAGNAFIPNARERFRYYDDFIGPYTGAYTGQLTSFATGAGASNIFGGAGGAQHSPGLLESTTGTTATGLAGIGIPLNIRMGSGTGADPDWAFNCRFNLIDLSTAAQEYALLVGFMNDWTTVDQQDGAYWLYDRLGTSTGSAASANPQAVTANSGTRTFVTSVSNVVITGWQGVYVTVNAAGNVATFSNYLNNGTGPSTIVSDITTNIPVGNALGFGWLLVKSAGTTTRTIQFDFIDVQAGFATKR